MRAASSDPLPPATRFEAVPATLAADVADPAERRRAERRAIDGRLLDAALRTVLAHLPAWGVVAGLGALLTALTLAEGDVRLAGAWGLPAAALALALVLLPRRARRPGAVAVRAAVGAGLLVFAAPPWLMLWQRAIDAPAAAAWVAGVSGAVAIMGATSLAPMWPLAMAAAALPLSAAAAAAVSDSRLTLALALLCAAAAVASAAQRRRAWRQNTRALIEQGERIRELEAERDEAWRADQEKSRFLAIASHDLRQPVHALALFTATLHKRMHGAPDEPLVRNMVRALDGLERSFNAMLDVSRLDAGSLAPTLQTFSLRNLFRRLHMHYGGQAELAGLGLRFSPGGKTVKSDPQLLERILGNLIQNSVKYTERGGIVVLARTTATHVNVEVWDTGAGIAPEQLPRIFDEFYQVGRGERDRAHGLGMGLAIVKRLVRLLGHSLVVVSRPGKGTMFRIGIAIGGLPGIQETMTPEDTVPMVASNPKLVLVIDDEEPIREGLRLLLEEWGYQSIAAADSAQAEQCVRAIEGHVDLILSDLHLGDGPDGLDAIDNVRRLCRNDVPAILVTGDTSGSEMRRIAASGHPVLFKPLQPRRLFDALQDLLG